MMMERGRMKITLVWDVIAVFEKGQMNTNDADAMTDGVVTGGRNVHCGDVHE